MGMLTDTLLTATDTLVSLPTPELPLPSWPGAPRDLARGALMPSQDISLTDTLPSSQSPTPPTATDLLDTELASFTLLDLPSSTCPGCTKITAMPVIYLLLGEET